MSLENQLKKAMGYTDDTSVRCPNCTSFEDSMCTANKALSFIVPVEGRCDLFSAKRPRRTESTPSDTPDIDPDFDEVDE